MSHTKQMTYTKALAELERIVARIESEDIDVDALSDQVRRASDLLCFCRTRLHTVEESVARVLGETETSDDPPAKL